MPDSADGTVEPDLSPAAGPPALAGGPEGSGAGEFAIGQRWRDLVIVAEVPGGAPRTWRADHVGLMESVVVRSFPIDDKIEWRRGAWERLCALPESRVVACREAIEESGWRYEISSVPPPTTLREWIACHRPGYADVERFVRQLSTTLGTLHAQGVVHLNLRPEAIFVDESRDEPVYLLGGLHEATLYTQTEVAPGEIDPRYAPPETVGRDRYPPGTRLCAWDWWSFGRVLQEFLLGQHVFELVFERDCTRLTPELRELAEQLLLEQQPPGVRAGALDFTLVEAVYLPLLRGLLTSACDARWGADAVQRWLRREPVRDHYDLARDARVWSWKGRIFTIAEAADFFTDAANWEIGEDMLFHPHDPSTLAAFLEQVPAYRADWERLQAVCDLAEQPAWAELPVVARRTVTAALGWLALAAGTGSRVAFRVCGHSIDSVGLTELLRADSADRGVALVGSLLSPAVVQFLEPFDPAAARVLKGVAEKGGVAIQEALRRGWIDPEDTGAQRRLLELSLQGPVALRERVELLRAEYASNADAELARMLAEKTPTPAELVLLAFTGEAAAKHGYITHERWRRQRCAALQGEGAALVRGLVWLELRRFFRIARLWGATPAVFAAATLLATAIAAWAGRSFAPAAIVAAALLGSRAWVWWRVRSIVRRFDPEAAPWIWTDAGRRADAELERVIGARRASIAEMKHALRATRDALAGLGTRAQPAPRIPQPHWLDVFAAAGFATGLALTVLILPAVRRVADSRPAAATEASDTAMPAQAVVLPPKPAEVPLDRDAASPEALLATGRYEIVDDGFGRRLRGPLRIWKHFAPAHVPRMQVDAEATASPEQSAFALVSGALLLQPYPRKGVSVLLAVPVPTTRGFGVMIFNARERELLNREVLLLHSAPMPETWYQIGSRRVLYLGSPLPLDAEISLAPR